MLRYAVRAADAGAGTETRKVNMSLLVHTLPLIVNTPNVPDSTGPVAQPGVVGVLCF